MVKDSVITTKIKTKLAAEHPGSMKHVSRVDTDKNGVVWMTGTVNNQEEANQAITIARNTEGVPLGEERPQGPEGSLTSMSAARLLPDRRMA